MYCLQGQLRNCASASNMSKWTKPYDDIVACSQVSKCPKVAHS
jgi:hypothetical protein